MLYYLYFFPIFLYLFIVSGTIFTSLDGRDEEDEWISKVHNRAFTTAALAEQNAVITSSAYDRIPYAVIEKQNHIQHQHPPHPQYITTYSTLIPVSKMGLQQQQQQQKVSRHHSYIRTNFMFFPCLLTRVVHHLLDYFVCTK